MYLSSDAEKRYQQDLEAYETLKENLVTSGNIIEYIGLNLIIMAMLIAAIFDEQIPVYVRVGLIIALGLVIAFKL